MMNTDDTNNKKNIKIITSENNKELEKRLKELSQELIVENYELYKELENC
jgi:hypothetical protein